MEPERRKERSPAPTEARMVPDTRRIVSLPELLASTAYQKYFRPIPDMQPGHLHLIGCSVHPLQVVCMYLYLQSNPVNVAARLSCIVAFYVEFSLVGIPAVSIVEKMLNKR